MKVTRETFLAPDMTSGIKFSCRFAAKLSELKRKIRVGAVSYLNTKPLLYGIERSECRNEMELILDYPAKIAQMLVDDEIDMGLVPVAVIPRLKEAYINTDYCIGADGNVASVCLFSETPIESVKTVILDYQSRTSAALTRILLKNYWKLSPEIINGGSEDYRTLIKEDTAGLVIGDRSLEQRKISTYVYDLADAWKAYTGLPFVFAAWISNKPIDPEFIARFDAANGVGMNHIDEIVAMYPFPVFDLKAYYTKHIDYWLDDRKRAGLKAFLAELKELQPVS